MVDAHMYKNTGDVSSKRFERDSKKKKTSIRTFLYFSALEINSTYTNRDHRIHKNKKYEFLSLSLSLNEERQKYVYDSYLEFKFLRDAEIV